MTESPTRWSARTWRRVSLVDGAYAAAIVVLAASAIFSGRMAARHLSPEGAASAIRLLDDLELPSVLPNAILERNDGAEARLWALTTEPRTIVSIYAPWCAPCQEELPMLVQQTAAQPARLLVIVGAEEDPAEVRQQLANIGLGDLQYHVDSARQVETGGRVTALPTTFLLGRSGRVHDRVVGYSQYRLQALVLKGLGTMPLSSHVE